MFPILMLIAGLRRRNRTWFPIILVHLSYFLPESIGTYKRFVGMDLCRGRQKTYNDALVLSMKPINWDPNAVDVLTFLSGK